MVQSSLKNFNLGIFLSEARKTSALALPMVIGQVGQLALSIVDSMMVGSLGVNALAGVSFGSAIMLFFLILAMGLCTPVSVFVAQARGPENATTRAEVLRHGIGIVAIYAIVVASVFTFFPGILNIFDQPEEVLVQARPYLLYTLWSILPALVSRCMRCFLEAQHHPWLPFYITALIVAINVPLNWIFIFGNLGAPSMGAAGAGFGTLLARIVGVIVFAYILYRRYHISWSIKSFLNSRWSLFRKLLALGIPTATQIAFEFGAVSATTIMMGWIGAIELSAQQITVNYMSLMFMIPLSVSFATTIRAGGAVHEGDASLLRRVGFSCIGLSLLLTAVITVITFTVRGSIAPFFIENQAVLGIVPLLLMWGAASQVLDGIQVTTMAVLRGIHDVWLPLLIVAASYWCIGIPAGYLFAFKLGFGAPGIWAGFALGLLVDAILLLWRFDWISQHLFSKERREQSQGSEVPVE